MDILFVVPYVPSLVRVRPYHLVRQMTARGHRVTVLTVWSGQNEEADADALRQWCECVDGLRVPMARSALNCLLAVPGPLPLQSVYSWQPILMKDIVRRAAEADVVHVEHLRGARYGVELKRALPQCPVIWDSVDCISLLFRQAARRSPKPLSRWAARFELGRTERYEGWLLHQFDRVLVTSATDREALLSLSHANGNGNSRPPAVGVLANGVDLAYFTPGPAAERAAAEIVITGKMSYHANVAMALHFVRDILPHIRARRPDVRVSIVGKAPPREVQALAEDSAVTVTGTVADIRPYLRRATLAAAPIQYGAGIQNKVLEALACATPTVASPQAAAALQAPLEGALAVASTPETFAEAVLQLLSDPERRNQMGAAGRNYVEAHHRWEAIGAELEGVYHGVLRADH